LVLKFIERLKFRLGKCIAYLGGYVNWILLNLTGRSRHLKYSCGWAVLRLRRRKTLSAQRNESNQGSTVFAKTLKHESLLKLNDILMRRWLHRPNDQN